MGRRSAFTLVEVLVAMTVLVLLIGMIAQLTSGMSSIIGRGQAHIDTDGQARALLDRMAIDFGAVVKRPDIDYYLKGRPSAADPNYLKQVGNDQIAFYTEVPGYFPASTPSSSPGSSPSSSGAPLQSTVSLVAYRINSATMRMERLCKGLAWSGGAASSTTYSMGFLPVPLASPLPSPLPSPMPSALPTPLFAQAAETTAADPKNKDLDFEELGPQVFRFEYYYVLKGQPATNSPPMLSLTPWYANAPVNHTSVNGMQDVAGIGILIAVIDPRSRALVSNDRLKLLAGNMEDIPEPPAAGTSSGGATFVSPGDIEKQWTATVTASGLPRSAIAAIRIYTRCFYLNGVSP